MAALVNPFASPVDVITGERDLPFCGGIALRLPLGFRAFLQQRLSRFRMLKLSTSQSVGAIKTHDELDI